MEDNKLMVNEEYEMEPVEEEETEEVQKSNFGSGLLLGGLLALGGYFLGKKAVKKWKEHKEKEPKVVKTDPQVIDITPDPVESDDEE